MTKFENGTFIGATWGERDGLIQRVHFIIDRRNPNGNLIIDGGESVPVRAVFLEEETEATARETPNLENARKSWGNFTPTGDFQVPLPPLAQ